MADSDDINWGKLGYLDKSQEEVLKTFLEQQKDNIDRIRYRVESPTECALRFLRARKFDLEKSLEIISQALQKFSEVSGVRPCLSSPYL
jgi:hypothetical protein